jgi:xanthine dehydrogenase accessory factor
VTAKTDNMPTVALEFLSAGQPAALATVLETWGSAPRRAGSQLAIAQDGTFFGSVSGGCVEGAVILAAQEALEDGQCRVLEFGVADDDAFAVGLACGGNIRILVEPIGTGNGPETQLVEALSEAWSERRAIGYQVDLDTWQRRLIAADAPEYTTLFAKDRSVLDGSRFTAVFNPPLKMIIVGAVHISQTLAAIARMAGYAVFIVDSRESFATADRFPDDTIVDAWPDEALQQIGIDARTAVVTLTHDPKLDNPALETALRSDAFYIGSLGSTRTHAKRVAHLLQAGLSEERIARIHAPIGLDIGSATPAEIAVAIMSEITESLRKPDTRK